MCCSDNYTLATCIFQKVSQGQPCDVQTTTLWQPVLFRRALCGNHACVVLTTTLWQPVFFRKSLRGNSTLWQSEFFRQALKTHSFPEKKTTRRCDTQGGCNVKKTIMYCIISLQLLFPLSKNILDSAVHSYIINNFMKADPNTQYSYNRHC